MDGGIKMELLEIQTTKVPHLKNVMVKDGGHQIGYFTRDVDGFFYFYTKDDIGSFDSNVLREIADKLDQSNKLWNDVINEEINLPWYAE